MKKRIIRSPGRKPPRGKEQPGILALEVTEFETADELQQHLENVCNDPDLRPFWDQQCEAFEAFARQHADASIMGSNDLTTHGVAANLLWCVECLRGHMRRGDSAGSIADAALMLAGAVVQLTVLVNE